jgi:peroxiredoxin
MFNLNKNSWLVMQFYFLISVSLLFAAVDKVQNFTLSDGKGKAHSLSDFKDAKAIVVMFIATRCPVSNAYNQRMIDLYKDYHDKKVAFLAINSNKLEDLEEVNKHAMENGFDFPVLKDVNNIVADKFSAQVTPEIFVLNSSFDILYHGRIDDSQREGEIKSKDLRKALDQILAGKEVGLKETKAFGCTIKRVTP